MQSAVCNRLTLALVIAFATSSAALGEPFTITFFDTSEPFILLSQFDPATGRTVVSTCADQTGTLPCIGSHDDGILARADQLINITIPEPPGESDTGTSDTFQLLLRMNSSVESFCFSSDPLPACNIQPPNFTGTITNGTAIETGKPVLLAFTSTPGNPANHLTEYFGASDVVPEPSSIFLVATSVLGLIGYRWRQARHLRR